MTARTSTPVTRASCAPSHASINQRICSSRLQPRTLHHTQKWPDNGRAVHIKPRIGLAFASLSDDAAVKRREMRRRITTAADGRRFALEVIGLTRPRSEMPSRSRSRKTRRAQPTRLTALLKVATGIAGFDEITGGGLPKGRPTLVCGGPGCGKTLFGLEFLVHGAARGESGVFVTFEETEEDIFKNVASLGYDVCDLVRRKRLALEYIRVERSEIEETGEYDLEGLFIRLDYALRSLGARRIVLDTIESLFAGLSDPGILRAELRRLFAWLKERGITAVITGERGVDTLTRQGLEEYVSDCVIFLDHRITDQISTRRLRIVKYRGSSHGTNEYPFLIDRRGIEVLPVTSLQLDPQGDVGASLHGPGLARSDVWRSRVLPRQQRAVFRWSRDGQNDPRGLLSGCRLSSRRARHLLPVRGITRADPRAT